MHEEHGEGVDEVCGLGGERAPGACGREVDGEAGDSVEDDGVGLPEGWTMTASRGTGLRNLASRLAAEFGDEASLAVSARHDGGVLASITLPFVRA